MNAGVIKMEASEKNVSGANWNRGKRRKMSRGRIDEGGERRTGGG